MNWNLYLNFLAAMLAIVNPVGIWPIWSELTSDSSDNKVRNRIALLITAVSFLILVVFLVSGKYLLQFFSIDLPVFKVAGGILLLYTGMSMVRGSATQLTDREEKGETALSLAKQRFKKIFVPMAIPALAGPGSITTVILFGTKSSGFVDYVFLSGVVFVAFLLLYIVFASSSYLEKNVDDIVFTVFTRVFGIIVTAIAVQFMVEGLGDIFPNWLKGASVLEEKKRGG